MSTYQVIVGNIGLVHESTRGPAARGVYAEYKRQSQSIYGRAAGESVTLTKDGEPVAEHSPCESLR